jgi:molecular chaperone GrpE
MTDTEDKITGEPGVDAGAERPGAASAQPEVTTPAPEGQEVAGVESLAERLQKAEGEIARLNDERLRALAEIENVRRRAARDREDAAKYAISAFARDILAVADNLRRALESIDNEARESDPGLDALANGVELTERELHAALSRYRIAPIQGVGQPFDPHVHEALFEVPDTSVPHGTVVQVLQQGYTIHDRTLRPARVGVSKGGPKPVAEAPEAETEEVGTGEVVEFPGAGAGAYGQRTEPRSENIGTKLDEKL